MMVTMTMKMTMTILMTEDNDCGVHVAEHPTSNRAVSVIGSALAKILWSHQHRLPHFNLFCFVCLLSSGPPKLDLDLGSSVSSVSDPDVSGVSDEEPVKKRDKQVSVVKQEEDSKSFDENQSDGKNLIDLKARAHN